MTSILVVATDDDAAALERTLTGLGYRASAATAADALREAERQRPDVVLVRAGHAGADGIAAALRERSELVVVDLPVPPADLRALLDLAVQRQAGERELARLQQQSRELSRRMAALGARASHLAHQISNPLSYIRTNIQFVRELMTAQRLAAPDDWLTEADEALSDADQGAEEVRRMVTELRAMSASADPQRATASPAAAAAAPAAPVAPAPSRPAAPVTALLTARPLLVVEDDPLVRTTLARILAGSFDLVMAEDARAALDRLARGERFPLILCDLSMPGMSGSELYRELVARYPEQAQRVLFVTGGAVDGADAAFLRAAPLGHLEKPFDRAALLARLSALVDTLG